MPTSDSGLPARIQPAFSLAVRHAVSTLVTGRVASNPSGYVSSVGARRRAAAGFGHSGYWALRCPVRERDDGRTAGDHEPCWSPAGVLAAVEVSAG